ncbi:MAG: glycine cleavage system protein GcvH [Simkania sp.]|nr:glycine cleavage system protein GcvH [Simkania sp.]
MRFTESHEWILINGEIGTVGITSYAQKELGSIVYIELPEIGRRLALAEEAVVLESTKAAADVYAPVSGEVIEVNEKLKVSCDLINQSPEKEGWLFKMKITAPKELQTLMEREEYLQLVAS